MTADYLTGDCAEPPQTTENLKDVVPRGAAICATVQAVGLSGKQKGSVVCSHEAATHCLPSWDWLQQVYMS